MLAFPNLEFKILEDIKILVFQNPELKILADIKILAFQSPEFKIVAFPYPEFKDLSRFQDFSFSVVLLVVVTKLACT